MTQHKDYHRILVAGDFHSPYEDPAAVSIVLRAIRKLKPRQIYLAGDIVDFYDASDHLRDPDRKHNLQAELDNTRALLECVRQAAGDKTSIVYQEGNHETRLRRCMLRNTPELACLRSNSLVSQLGLRELNIVYRPEADHYNLPGGMVLMHGVLLRSYAGYTARGLIDKLGSSCGCGHTHRLACIYRTVWGKRVLVGFENGCLCSLDPTPSNAFTKGVADWQQGFTILHVWTAKNGKKRVDAEQFLIVNGETRPF